MARSSTPRKQAAPRAPRTPRKQAADAPPTAPLAAVPEAAEVIDLAAWADRLGHTARPAPAAIVYALPHPFHRYLTPQTIEATESPIYDEVVRALGSPPRTVPGEAFAIEDAETEAVAS